MTTTRRAVAPSRAARRSPIATAIRWATGAALTVAVVGVVALTLGTFTGWLAIQTVPTGSMEPSIERGSIIVVDPIAVDDITVGEVIVFAAPETGRMTVHRVTGIEQTGTGPVFTTKGDANQGPDPWRLEVEGDHLHQVRWSIPWVGQVLLVLSAPEARLALMAVGLVLVLSFGMALIWRDEPAPDGPGATTTWDGALARLTGAGAHRWPDTSATVEEAHDDLVAALLQPAASTDRRAHPTPDPEQARSDVQSRIRRMSPTSPGGALVVVVLAGTLAWFPAQDADAAYTGTSAAVGPASTLTVAPKTDTSCTWTSTTALSVSWANPNPTDGAQVLVATTPGGVPTVAVTAAAGATSATYSPSPATTVRHLSTRSVDGTWTSAPSPTMATNSCTGSITAYAGSGSGGADGDGGAATEAELDAPLQTAVAPDGRVFIADSGNDRIRVVSTSGVISTFAGGSGGASACTFSGPVASLRMDAPRGVAVDGAGNVYIADTGSDCIRRVDPAGNVTLFAGGGGTSTCNTTVAPTSLSLADPSGLAVDPSGALIVADTGRDCVRRLTATTTTRVAGGGTTSGCATTTAAGVSLADPLGVAVDAAGAVYVADTGRNCVRKVVGTTVTVVVGGGTTNACTASTTSTAVRLNGPQGVAVAPDGTVYVADTGRRCVRRVVGTAVSHLAFTGANGSLGDDGPAIGARARTPSMLTVLGDGDLLVSDRATNNGANVVRRIELS
jgi:signal peptidase I